MEILELLLGLAQFGDMCVCLLETLTLAFDGTAAVKGVQTFQKRKIIAEKQAHQHGGAPLKKPSWWPFIILMVLGLLFTTLTIYKYTR